MTARQRRTGVLGSVFLLLGVPPALAVVEWASFFVANRSNGSFVSSGEKRDYLVYVPRSYARTQPTPLVISIHGAGLWGAAQKETSQWNTAADRGGFIVVYPSGFPGSGPRIWREDHDAGLAKDVRFIAELIDTLERTYNIDPGQIYANGLSNGGGMAFALSCALSDRIAAVGMVAAAQLRPWEWCTDRRPVPMIAFHGTADRQVPYHGGKSWAAPDPFPNVPTWTAKWARRNRCDPTPVDSAVARDVTRRSFTNCANDAAVVLYTIEGGGHTWPGGKPLPQWFVGPTTTSIDATGLMWAFFRKHPLRGARTTVSAVARRQRTPPFG